MEGAVAAQRLAERADGHVNLVLEPELVHEPRALCDDDAGGMGLVDHHSRAVAPGELDDASERCEIPVHREDGVRDDQGRPPGRPLEAGGQGVEGGMVIDDDGRAAVTRLPSAADRAGPEPREQLGDSPTPDRRGAARRGPTR